MRNESSMSATLKFRKFLKCFSEGRRRCKKITNVVLERLLCCFFLFAELGTELKAVTQFTFHNITLRDELMTIL